MPIQLDTKTHKHPHIHINLNIVNSFPLTQSLFFTPRLGLPVPPVILRPELQDMVQSSRDSGDEFKTEIENQYSTVPLLNVSECISQPPLVPFLSLLFTESAS